MVEIVRIERIAGFGCNRDKSIEPEIAVQIVGMFIQKFQRAFAKSVLPSPQ